jgi:hypothetical protein
MEGQPKANGNGPKRKSGDDFYLYKCGVQSVKVEDHCWSGHDDRQTEVQEKRCQ